MLSAHDVTLVGDKVAAYADNPSAFLALSRDNQYFMPADRRGVVVYRRSGRYFMQFAAPFAPAEERAGLLRDFLAMAAAQRCRVVTVQLQHQDIELYAEHGFTVNQIGASYAVNLVDFSLRGKSFMQLRNKISRARRAGFEVVEADAEEYAKVEADLADIDQEWLRTKGRHTKALRFLVGEHGGPAQRWRRLFVARLEGRTMAYVSYSPVHGQRPGWLYDLSRRRGEVTPGVMELINSTAIEKFRAEGSEWLHFGFTPFVGLDPSVESATASRSAARLVRFLSQHGEFVYPAASQVAYKEKWKPDVVLPEYIGFQGRPRLSAVWLLLRLANAV
jgi:lysylphosphatidylglycerol synthetase-like protein (DUF2156 family)